MNVLFRVLIAAFVCVAPTALFLGLWHGLKRMRNGELVERVAEHHGASVEDLIPGARSGGTRDLDSRERRALERAVADGTSPSTESPAADGYDSNDERDRA